MKKKLVMTMLMLTMVVGMAACGQEKEPTNDVSQEISVEQSTAERKEEKVDEAQEEVVGDDLPNWKGVKQFYGNRVSGKGNVDINISYPSLVPTTNGNWAYQVDPALILVTCTGYDEQFSPIPVDSLEESFEVAKEHIVTSLGGTRQPSRYSDFDFLVETSELITINDLETCYYTGKHTCICDGELQEIPFVAYAIDTKQLDAIYPIMVIVMDDSINNTSMEPLPEGTIEAYAKKMVESINFDGFSFN